ncbi:MAG: SET domain-containing protein-lysine N-methyltransferase [bacterium]
MIKKHLPSVPKLVIKDTGKYGRGVFAGEDIKKEKKIYILSGPTMTTKKFAEMVNTDKENIDDPLQVGKRTYINLDKTSRTFNHSCNPNTGLRKRSELFALININKGDEITYDYSSTIAPTEFRMKCCCGSKNCRRIIGDIRSIPDDKLSFYKEEGALQRYMKIIVRQLENNTYKIPNYEIELLESLKKTDNL